MSGSRSAGPGAGADGDGCERTTDDADFRGGALSLEPEDLSKDLHLARAAHVRFRGEERPAVGKMILLARLGQGGMGVVYFGLHPRLNVEVAVKV